MYGVTCDFSILFGKHGEQHTIVVNRAFILGKVRVGVKVLDNCYIPTHIYAFRLLIPG